MTERRSPVQVRCYRSKSWIKRAKVLPEDDLDGKFIYYWIAFNSLYGQPKYLSHKKGPEEIDFERFLALVCESDQKHRITEILETLKWPIIGLIEDHYLNDDCWVGWYERELETLSERNKHVFRGKRQRDNISELFSRIYVLRKQLFHGCSSDKGRKNRESLGRAVAVLEKLIPVFEEIIDQSSNDNRLTKFLKDLPYPPTVGGVG